MTHANQEWFSDDEFWKLTYTYMFPASRVDAATTEVEQLLALVNIDHGKVLDLACGPGRHSVLLAQRGFEVTGVDKSAFLLDRARERSAMTGVDVEWIREDMRTFRRPGAFDLVLCLFTSFGFFEDDADNQRVLANAAANLRAGGTFVLDMMGKEQIARIFNPTSSSERPEGLSIHRRRIVDDWTRIENEWILLHDGHARTLRFQHWIYSAREITQMTKDAGFADVSVFGSLAGEPYGTDASRLIVVART
ncbi:MAG TPA: class I SAM-dependent methyltransferase [Gemmatimonadaceae bacterium]